MGMLFRSVGASFAWWYNNKYERCGHIFQDRFKSEPVDSEQYLFTVFRYILRNPVKAGLCSSPEEYPYSSAPEYMNHDTGKTDTSFIMSLMSGDRLRNYIEQDNSDECLEMETSLIKRGVTDAAAIEKIKREFGTLTPNPGKKTEREDFQVESTICIEKEYLYGSLAG